MKHYCEGNDMGPVLYFVVPCFNEEEVVKCTTEALADKLNKLISDKAIGPDSGILLIDDGSTDSTWEMVKELAASFDTVSGISLDGNYGQQVAIYAGLLDVKEKCDVSISLDADGQNDLAAVDRMLEEYRAGNEIVCAVRRDRKRDGAFKRATAEAYYWLLEKLGSKTMEGHADFRLVSSNAIDMLEHKAKRTVFLRSDFLKLPVKSTQVKYECGPRLAGKTKYSIRKMAHLAVQGLISNGKIPVGKPEDCTRYKLSDCV